MKTLNLVKGDTPVRAREALVIEPARSWQRLQHAREFFFEDLEAQMKEHHRQFLESLMGLTRKGEPGQEGITLSTVEPLEAPTSCAGG